MRRHTTHHTMRRNVRFTAWVLFLAMGLTVVTTSFALGSGTKMFIPLVGRDNGISYSGATELRLDNIALWDLDTRLQDYGITDPAVRSWVYGIAYAARQQDASPPSPEGYPSPAGGAEPEMTAFLPLPCFAGQGCHVVWTGFGTMRSHFQLRNGGWMPWTVPGIKCPGPKVCMVLASIGADTSLPAINQRQYTGFGMSSLGVPFANGFKCFWVM